MYELTKFEVFVLRFVLQCHLTKVSACVVLWQFSCVSFSIANSLVIQLLLFVASNPIEVMYFCFYVVITLFL
jgi:hypothetical protein